MNEILDLLVQQLKDAATETTESSSARMMGEGWTEGHAAGLARAARALEGVLEQFGGDQ